MIEIEKKFPYTKEIEERLIADAEFLHEIVNNDTYFDSETYSLTTKDYWLRKRNDRFELKVPMHELGGKGSKVEHYKELEADEEIQQELDLDTSIAIEEALANAGYKPFANIQTTRRSYNKDGFHIDLDTANFGYQIVEIELMIENDADQKAAEQKLIKFAKRHGLKMETVRGKIITWLYANDKKHFQALVDAGVVWKT